MNQETVRLIRAVSSLASWEEMEALAEILGVVLPAGSSLSRDLVMPTDREPEMPDLWLRATLFYRLFAGAVVVIVIISVVIGIFVQPLFEIGRNRFYMESRVTGQSAGIGKLFWGFSNGYLKLVGTQFLRSLITEGIVFLCMAPGLLTLAFNRFLIDWMGSAVLMACGAVVGTCFSIYFQYCYLMVPYILAENPDMKAREALRLSKEMMDGQKWNAFVLGLSFIGWQLLGTLLCGIGTFFVQPYVDATFAELYAVLRGTVFRASEWIRRGTVCTE